MTRKLSGHGISSMFAGWICSPHPQPYGSFGNGAAMRVSPVGWLFNTEEDVLAQSRATAEITHNHPEGIRGAVGTIVGSLAEARWPVPEWMRPRALSYLPSDMQTILEKFDFYKLCLTSNEK